MSARIQNGPRHFETIVIGAGMSGLACAARLFQHRARGSLVVLEARNRIGGRIGSEYVNGNRLDTGANWIHGTGTEDDPNPLMKVLPHKRYRQLSGMVAFRPHDEPDKVDVKQHEVMGENGGWNYISSNRTSERPDLRSTSDLVIPSEAAGTLMSSVWGAIGSLHERSASMPADEAKRTTMLSAVANDEMFREAFNELPSEYHPALRSLPQFLEPMEAAPLAAQSAEHDSEVSGMSLLEFAIEDFDGDQVYLQDGYTAVVEEVAKDLVKADAIHHGVEVEQITWDTTPITLQTNKGTYTAGNVVCSIPLGVLKQRRYLTSPMDDRRPPLFSPELPQEYLESISSLGYGTLDKIFLVYSNPWWTQEPFASVLEKGISRRPFATGDTKVRGNDTGEPDSFWGFTHELPGISISEDGTVSTGPRLLSIMNLNSLCGFPVLSAFVSCANAVHVENSSNADAGALVHSELTSWFGREPPKPDAVHVTRWASDEFSRGSYSNMITGISEMRHRETFQRPIANKDGSTLRFAGEHTSKNHFATVHGALLSGWREADAILGSGK